MKKNKIYRLVTIFCAVLLGVLSGVLSYQQVLKNTDQTITNWIYNKASGNNSQITIIAIDQDSEDTYGEPDSWSRSLLAQAVKKANEEQASTIGLYMDLSEESETDEQGDTELVEACGNAQDVVALASLSQSTPGNTENQTQSENFEDAITYPFASLKEQVTVGVSSNQTQQNGPNQQNAELSVTRDAQEYDSFATAVYRQYLSDQGKEYTKPKVDSENQFGFQMVSVKNVISFTDFLSGDYDQDEIRDHVVLIGEYDQSESTEAPSQTDQQGVSTQASIIQSLLSQDTLVEVSQMLQSLICGFLVAILYLLISRPKVWQTISSCLMGGAAIILIAFISNRMGYRILFLIPVLFAGISLVLSLAQRLFFSIHEKRRMERTLKMYVDPHVADEITQIGDQKINRLGTRRDIAVLFVDLRGFTAISESLEPEQVVEILNEYLSRVAQAVARYNGTLDKFIGDAAMALFNAPQNLENYELTAVETALEIARQSDQIREKFLAKYGKTVSYGIGINCGEAIVGNIGSLSHMDYTAIGDTVNIASRLEGIADANQILISQELYERVKDKITVEEIGEVQLKGKMKKIKAFQVTGLQTSQMEEKGVSK